MVLIGRRAARALFLVRSHGRQTDLIVGTEPPAATRVE